MSSPNTHTKTEPTPLYMSDKEIMERIGICDNTWRRVICILEPRGFPKKDPLFSNKRFWPAVEKYLYKRAGSNGIISASDAPKQETW